VLGSVFDDAMPLERLRLADAAVPLDALPLTLDRVTRQSRHASADSEAAGDARVVAQLLQFL